MFVSDFKKPKQTMKTINRSHFNQSNSNQYPEQKITGARLEPTTFKLSVVSILGHHTPVLVASLTTCNFFILGFSMWSLSVTVKFTLLIC